MIIKLFILMLFFAVTVSIGFYCRRQATSVGGFVLGSRNAGPWISAFAYGTSYFSSVVFIGYAGQFGFTHGLSAAWIGIANAVVGSFLAWKLLAKRTRKMTRELNCSTMPDFLSKRYDCKPLKTVSALLIFIFLIPYSASVYKGLSQLFVMAFGIDFIWCMLAMAALTAVYVVVGGYMATALNDLVQGVIMIVGIVAIIFSVLSFHGGLGSSVMQLSEISGGKFTTVFGPEPISLLSVSILTSLGAWGLPQMTHKFYTIKDEKSIKSATIISTLFALVIAGGSYFMGAFGRLFVGDSPARFDTIVPDMLAAALPDILIGVVVVVVLSASMSTLASLVIASSSTVVLDLIVPFFNKKAEDVKVLRIVRIFCVVFIVASVLLAIIPSSVISSLMGISWGALSGCFLGPYVYSLFSEKITVIAVWASFATSLTITIMNLFLGIVSPIDAGAIAIVASLVVTPLVSAFTYAHKASAVRTSA